MELSDEQKQRILEEEQQRIAEEEYRTQVRRDLQRRATSASPVPAKGSYTITGGAGRDVGVALVGPGGNVIVNSGRVSGFGQFRQRLARGSYAIIFDNRFSTFSPKSVSSDLKITYYK
jgi:hypothetical protein